MTPTITHHRLVEQRTGTWDDLRRGIATASAMANAIRPGEHVDIITADLHDGRTDA